MTTTVRGFSITIVRAVGGSADNGNRTGPRNSSTSGTKVMTWATSRTKVPIADSIQISPRQISANGATTTGTSTIVQGSAPVMASLNTQSATKPVRPWNKAAPKVVQARI